MGFRDLILDIGAGPYGYAINAYKYPILSNGGQGLFKMCYVMKVFLTLPSNILFLFTFNKTSNEQLIYDQI